MSINTHVAAAMDRVARLTGIPQLIFDRPEPRSLRWIPLFVLAAFPLGYLMILKAETADGLHSALKIGMTGAFIFYGAVMASFVLRFLGPRFDDQSRPLDEREKVLSYRAGSLTGVVVVTMVVAGCFYFSLADFFGWWRPASQQEWLPLGFGLQGTYFALRVLIASWLQPRAPANEEAAA